MNKLLFQATILIFRGIKEFKRDLEDSDRQPMITLYEKEKELKKMDKDLGLKVKDLTTKIEELSKKYSELEGNVGEIINDAKIFSMKLASELTKEGLISNKFELMTKTMQLIHNNYKGISFVPMLLVRFEHNNDIASLLHPIIYRRE
ncbi:unnamed protein product [Lactuca saligna]|uniref:Uncharacterized protein n=1 Tax=Lactuca saligna TaxID=75948 RepID=A0AA35VN34_LACSI|nr:unnamed protein product [Lactuca saligna]